ncbi:hypothetical protein ACFQH6_03860 [Halobacteriaceae archaeon GCM10025711]
MGALGVCENCGATVEERSTHWEYLPGASNIKPGPVCFCSAECVVEFLEAE